MVRAMCEVQLMDRKRAKDLMLVLGLNETIHQSYVLFGHILRRSKEEKQAK